MHHRPRTPIGDASAKRIACRRLQRLPSGPLRAVAIVFSFLPLFACATVLEAQQIRVSAGDGSLSAVAPGATFSLPIHFDLGMVGAENLASATFSVAWDPAVLSYQSSTTGPFGQVVLNESQIAAGVLTVSVFSPAGTTTSFDAVFIDFTSGNAETTTTITPQVSAAGNQNGIDISGIVVEVPLSLCVGTLGLRGDVTADGLVNILDAQQLARSSVNLPAPPDPARVAAVGDVTLDGSVNILDAQQIARFSVGLSASPAIGEAVVGCSASNEEIYCLSPGTTFHVVILDSVGVPIGGNGQFSVLSFSGSPVPFNLTTTASWLRASPSFGSTPFIGAVGVYGDPSLTPGTPVGADIVPVTAQAMVTGVCTVNLFMLQPIISPATNNVSLAAQQGATTPVSTSVQLHPLGINGFLSGYEATATISYPGVSGWLSAEVKSGARTDWIDVSGCAFCNFLDLMADPSGVPVGTHAATVSIFSPRYEGIDTVDVVVELEVTPNAITLTNQQGITVSGQAGSVEQYMLSVPSGVSGLSFVTDGGSGNVHLLARKGQMPSLPSTADCVSARLGSQQNCSFGNPGADTWYVLLFGASGYQDVELTAWYETDNSTYDIRTILRPSVPSSSWTTLANAFLRFESLITGDIDGVYVSETLAGPCGSVSRYVDDLQLIVEVVDIPDLDDGVGSKDILARAAPCLTRPIGQGHNGLPVVGWIEFDSDDFDALAANGALVDVAEHELGHVLGLGTIWNQSPFNLLAASGTTDPYHVGSATRFRFDQVGGTAYVGNKVPVEPADEGHWRESVFQSEVMSPLLSTNGSPNPLSSVTLGGLDDLGYQVQYLLADPYTLPTTAATTAEPGQIDLSGDLDFFKTWQHDPLTGRFVPIGQGGGR